MHEFSRDASHLVLKIFFHNFNLMSGGQWQILSWIGKMRASTDSVISDKFVFLDDTEQELPWQSAHCLGWNVQGKRVVFLKQLTSELLLVTGPFKINGVPLRRVNQSYVVATSTKVDVSGVDVPKLDGTLSAKAVDKKKKERGEREFFEAEKEEMITLPQEKKEEQKTVDGPLIKAIEAVPELKTYLAARFSLKAGMKPHELVF